MIVTELQSWQMSTVNCGLMLAAASSLRLDPVALQRQVHDAIDSVPVSERGAYGGEAGEWTSVLLVSMPFGGGQDYRRPGIPAPVLARLPILGPVMDRLGGLPNGAYIIRQPAGGFLRWHFDNQALHLDFCRLLITVQAAAAAFTWIGHEKVAFPEGTLWTGDFSLPHQVENPSDQDRLVIALDYAPSDAIRALFPPALYAEEKRRMELSLEGVGLLQEWRHQCAGS